MMLISSMIPTESLWWSSPAVLLTFEDPNCSGFSSDNPPFDTSCFGVRNHYGRSHALVVGYLEVEINILADGLLYDKIRQQGWMPWYVALTTLLERDSRFESSNLGPCITPIRQNEPLSVCTVNGKTVYIRNIKAGRGNWMMTLIRQRA